MKNKILLFIVTMLTVVSVNAETVFDWANNVGTIEATGTTELASKVKLHTNTDEVPAIKFANGYSIDTTQTPAVHANYVELSVDGGFKAGDVVKVEFCYNNKDAKVATVGVYNLEGKEIAASGEGANARLTNETSTFNYALTEDMDKIRLARAKSGKTTTFIISLVVVRGEKVEVKAQNPQFSALPGKYYDPFKLGISSSEEGAKIYYRLGETGMFKEYIDSIDINELGKTYIIEAFATNEWRLNSDTIKCDYILEKGRPVFNARKIYTFNNLKEEDIQFVSEGNGEKATYIMDGKPCPSVNYKHLAGSNSPDSVLITTTKGQEEVTFRYKNGFDKNNVIKCLDNFMQMDSKNFEIWIDNVNSGDTIVFVVTAKGSAPQFDVTYSSVSYLEPYMPEDDTDPCFTDGLVMTASDARVENNYSGWQDLVYTVAEGGHSCVRIKETNAGFRIAKILVGAYRGELIPTYTVTFVDYDGRIISQQFVPQGGSASAPSNPYREGYLFAGWDKEFSNVTSDLTITAKYASELSGKCGQDSALTWIYEPENQTLTISGNGALTNNYTYLTAAQRYAKNIIVQKGITAIGYEAFNYCDSLQSIAILNGNASLEENILYRSLNVQNIEAPAGIFAGPEYYYVPGFTYEVNIDFTHKLQTVKINGGKMRDEYFTLLGNSQKTLQTLDLSAAEMESFPESALADYRQLSTIVLPYGLKNINYAMAANCYYLQAILIPAGVTEIDDRAFDNCRSLASVEFAGNAVKRIGDWSFYNCHELANIVIPEGVTEIGKAAFYGCAYAKAAHLPASLQSIGDNGFAGCSKMAQMIVDAVVPPTVGPETFDEVSTEAPVYVPEGSVEAYQSHPVWGKLNIVGDKAPQGIEDVHTNGQFTKIIRDGQIVILRGDKIYTVTGQELK